MNLADGLREFLDDSPSPYHVIEVARKMLLRHGFEEVSESAVWETRAGAKQFLTRSGKAMIAWISGSSSFEQDRFRIVAAHTDSPCLKPRSLEVRSVGGSTLLDVNVYGSPITPTWLDRDLALAGAAYLRGSEQPVLFKIPDIKLRTISLAIHLDKALKTNGLNPNAHNHLNCIYSSNDNLDDQDLNEKISDKINVKLCDIFYTDTFLYDVVQSEFCGSNGEFLSSGRIDNVFSCYAAIISLMRQSLAEETKVIALFDAEEIGSLSYAGARSGLLEQTLLGIFSSLSEPNRDRLLPEFYRMLSRSSLLSLDMAHGLHPLFNEVSDRVCTPKLNLGPALKNSAKGHYSVSPLLTARVREKAASLDIPLQNFQYRNDIGGGTSLGPMVAARPGIETIDVGAPLLSMHSIRELCGTKDIESTVRLLSDVFFNLD